MERKGSQIATKQKIKIVFLGDKGVGKSSIISKFALNKFEEHTQATIGVDFLTKQCKYNSSKYKLQLWDTAGQEKYRSLIKGYLRGAYACVFVYDTSNPTTYTNLIDWMKTFEEVSKDEKTYVIIFGNKTDLPRDKNQLQKAQKEVAKNYPKISQILSIEGSAKQGLNIQQIFQEILQNFEQYSNSSKKIDSTKSIGQNLIKSFNKNGINTFLCIDYIKPNLIASVERLNSLERARRLLPWMIAVVDIFMVKLIISLEIQQFIPLHMATIFEQVGGHDKLEKIVAQFYQYILTDDRINYFFLENVSDIPKLHSTMVLFLTHLFGGPNHYTGPDMYKLHKNMPIRQQHFDITWEHMEAAFLVFKLSQDLIRSIRVIIYSTQKDIVRS